MLASTITVDPSVLNHPAVLWVLVVTGILAIVLAFFRRESGAFGEWLARMRRAAEDRENVRVSALETDVEFLKRRDKERTGEFAVLQNEMRKMRSERDALVDYLREWWNWALAGADGSPPKVPPTLTELLPPASWTWRPGYRTTHPQPPHEPPVDGGYTD